MKFWAGLLVFGCVAVQGLAAQESASRKMAATVVEGGTSGSARHEGMLLNGMAAEWHTTGDGDDFHYIQGMVDRYVGADGTVAGFAGDASGMGAMDMARAVLLAYRVTQQPRYYKAAKFLHDQPGKQFGMASGGHRQSSSRDRSVDISAHDVYIAEPFRAAYAAAFDQPGEFAKIADRLLLMGDAKTGWRPAASVRAMGWYAMALVDVLDWMPSDQPQRREMIAALNRTVAAAVKDQDARTGLWRGVAGKGAEVENRTGVSTSCMFVYALAKGVRMGYLPQADEASARRGWVAVEKEFAVMGADGGRAKSGNDDGADGAFLLAGSEMEQAGTEALGEGKTVLVDAWFNSQTRQNAAGQAELFHYKWDDDSNSGFSFFGRVFQRYGAKLATEKTAPTAGGLKKAQVYILASPDIPSKNPNPHYMDDKSGRVIAEWVKRGGVLLLMENDGPNAEFEHFNTLSERFGIHFNQVLVNHVVGDDLGAGELKIQAGTGVFAHPHLAYMKDTCTISVKAPAKAVLLDKGDVMIAVANYGKGTVFAVVDPWVYNEYTDRRNHLPAKYDTFAAAIDLAGWAVGR